MIALMSSAGVTSKAGLKTGDAAGAVCAAADAAHLGGIALLDDDGGAPWRWWDRWSRRARPRRTGCRDGGRARPDRRCRSCWPCRRWRRSGRRPVTTRSTSPRFITKAAATSEMSRWGMPSRTSSHAVSREPCMTGRVSSTHTSASLPSLVRRADHAEGRAVSGRGQRAGVAVGQDARLRRHERPRRGRPSRGWRPRPRRGSPAPPRAGAAAARRAAAARCARAARRIRSSAQNRLTAVGRVAPSPLMASSRSARRPSQSIRPLWRAASATPKAAATPMAGAPRTTSERIASATSGQVAQGRSTSSTGSLV